MTFIIDRRIFPDEQFGFRGHHSKSHQVLRICQHVKENRALGKSTGLVLLDIEKAFDSVWHNGIVYKMIDFGFPLYLIKTIQSFLTNRRFRVYVNSKASSLQHVYAGVPQGSVLGPVLYNVYTSDFPRLPACGTAIYADDTGIFSSHEFSLNIETNLQNAIRILVDYFNKWKIKLNAGKVQSIFFSRKRKSCYLPSNPLNVCGVRVDWKPSVKYLGIHLDEKLTFKEHISNTINKVNIATKMLYLFINRKSILCSFNKIVIHKVIFQAILLYG